MPTTISSSTLTTDNVIISGTGASSLSAGTTAQRPVSPTSGMARFNTTTNQLEIYNGSAWTSGAYNVSYLVVAGGGGAYATGGGAGGMLTSTISVTQGTAYTITVGAGGAAAPGVSPWNGSNGGNSSFGSLVSTTGGGGGSGYYGTQTGGNGGSGGGGYTNSIASAGTGIAGQGNRGGYFVDPATYGYPAGGGAGAVGAPNSGIYGGGAGGRGLFSNISGTNSYYAGGGGGGADTNYGGGGAGGEGGGGGANLANQNGVANTGGGGGGGWYGGTPRNSGVGGSGIVIVAYTSPSQKATGGTVTSYTYSGVTIWCHTFTTSGTFTA